MPKTRKHKNMAKLTALYRSLHDNNERAVMRAALWSMMSLRRPHDRLLDSAILSELAVKSPSALTLAAAVAS